MGLVDKFLDAMRLNDDEYDDEYEEEYEKEPAVRQFRKPQRQEAPARQAATPLRVVKKGSMEICSGQPKDLEDIRDFADELLMGKSILLNLEKTDYEKAQRIIDFISGACYALDGNLQRVSEYVFVVTPRSTDLSGEFEEMEDKKGKKKKTA